MSLLASPTGHLTNLSTVRGEVAQEGEDEETAAEVFAERISGPVVQGKCIACHVDGGVAGPGLSRLQFVRRASNPNHEAVNLKVFEDFIAGVENGATYILEQDSGGGARGRGAGGGGHARVRRHAAVPGVAGRGT